MWRPFFRFSIAVPRISAPGCRLPMGVTRRSCSPVAAVPITTILFANSVGGRVLIERLNSSYTSEKDTRGKSFRAPRQASTRLSWSGTAKPRSMATRAGSEGICQPAKLSRSR
ncbi:hypothetical protein D3C83_63480 [compost metagenome]